MMEAIKLKREFVLMKGKKEIVLGDIESLSPKEVIKMYAGQYPELNQIVIPEPTINDDKLRFVLQPTLGSKG